MGNFTSSKQQRFFTQNFNNMTKQEFKTPICGKRVLPAVSSTKKTIKLLEDLVKDLEGTCTFWACEGHEKMVIKNMITCRPCASVIRMKREIKRLKLLEGSIRLEE
jgi:hypothetical protein